MKKITSQIAAAFHAGRSLSVGNTRTDGESVWLHGNKIIRTTEDGSIEWTLAGWNTVTTRERINGIVDAGVYNKQWVAHVGTREVSDIGWNKVETE